MGRRRTAEFFFALGPSVGMGHLRRCEALAGELARRGWTVRGWAHGATATETPPVAAASLAQGFPVEAGRPQPGATLAVIDSYWLAAAERAAPAAGGTRLASFCDWPAPDPAELVVDFNVGADPAAYAAAGCRGKLLAGPDFFPARAGLRELAAESPARDRSGPARRLVLCFGGSDAGRAAAARSLKELTEAGLDLEIRAVAGNLAGAEVGGHFAWADLVLSAGGVTKYELALFGVPAIIVAIAENQELVGERFAAAGSARYLGPAARLAPGALARAVRELAADGAARAAMSAAGRRLVDGQGAGRIADEVERLVEGGS